MVHAEIEEETTEEEPIDVFQERLILFVALFTAVSLISATVMGVAQLLKLEVRRPGGHTLPLEANDTADASDWSVAAAASPWRPIHYDLLLHPRMENRTYDGYVHAVFEIQHNARKIVLDCSRKLEIMTTVLRWQSFPVRVTRVLRDGSKIVIDTTHLLRKGRTYNLTVQFQGRFGRESGLVMKRDGNEVVLLMLPWKLDAHVSFPCFKDPGWKTTFDVRLLTDEHLRTSSTARVMNVSTQSNGTVVHVFHRTEPMSAYQLTAIFTNFTMVSHERFNFWTTAALVPYRSTMLRIIGQAMDLLEELVGAWSNTSQVLDLVVVPNLPKAALSGAGFIGIRQGELSRLPVYQRSKWVVPVILHIVLQFFVSYATPRVLKDIWVAASLAYPFQRQILQHVGLGEYLDQWRLLERSRAMHNEDNGLNCSSKRTMLIFSMLADLCPVTIDSGIKRYMKENEYGVADGAILWRTLDLSGLLSRHMDTWTDYGGYPVLSVLRVDDARGPGLILKQGWHCFDDLKCNETLVWAVPFVLDVQGGVRVPEKGALWFRGNIQRYNVARDLSSSWFLVNTATVSYFRVQYDANNVALLTRQLLTDHTVLTDTARALFLDDMVALTVRRMVSVDALVGLLTYLQKEESCAVWQLYSKTALKALEHFSGRTEYRPFYLRNQEVCILLQLEPAIGGCLEVMRRKTCCNFISCTTPHTTAPK
ncbi:thyrotropin-releasing hormone-degrading ectoenzyme-like [Dermacentor albipictus]|uniref:thyrotropin-releasing hormone-degrading ectoenzyme-like n=1 Tax=Dermacentor albipictus TaxID=60249 RepID=UPI0031FD3DEB